MTRLFFCDLRDSFIYDILADRHDAFLHTLPDKIKHKLKGLRNFSDYLEQLVGKLLVSYGMRQFGRKIDFANLKMTSFQRPYFDGCEDFNISHCTEYAACIISNEGKVGIDVERIKPIDIHEFDSFLTIDERVDIASGNDSVRNFYALWTKKEAVLKASGFGLSLSPKQVKILKENDYHVAVVDNEKYYITGSHNVTYPYCCHFASDFSPSDLTIEFLTPASFTNL